MNKNFKLVIEYDGSSFLGWQRQPKGKTIQNEIEKALSYMLNQKIQISGSGRTDAGVHAFSQTASFTANTKILPSKIKKAVNSLIKDPIVIKNCHCVSEKFHARYSAVSKEYNYFILNSKDPCAIKRQYQWHVAKHLDIKKMNQCCKLIVGKMDFKSFENTGSPKSSTIREVFYSKIENLDHQKLIFKICANGFLKYMVRNLIGTIVLVGLGKISVNKFTQILLTRDRNQAGPTAPPHGLFLNKVNY